MIAPTRPGVTRVVAARSTYYGPRAARPRVMSEVFITALGKFFPGPPIANDEMEDYLGRIHDRPARAKARVLAQNGITSRHYALDRQQRTLFRNSEMAANAVRDLLA